MSYTEQEVRAASVDLIESFDDLLIWHWEADKNVLLAEFASGKADKVISILNQNFPHKWNRKSISKAPISIKQELGNYTKLIKEQCIYTRPPTGNNKIVTAILWPWGHGSTLSLRLTLLANPYVYKEPVPKQGLFTNFIGKAKRLLS